MMQVCLFGILIESNVLKDYLMFIKMLLSNLHGGIVFVFQVTEQVIWLFGILIRVQHFEQWVVRIQVL